jgi:hypothetical protein
MRVMFIVKAAAAAPTPELLDAMHELATREIAAGRMLDDGGLMPLNMGGARITNARGKVAVLDGPFAESKEVIGGYAVFEVKDRDEGLAMGMAFMQLHVDHMPGWEGVLEMREVAGSQTRPL